jgi:hypothetical protein
MKKARKLREFLYVDTQRARSYLSQLEGGFIEGASNTSDWTHQLDIAAKVSGVGAEGTTTRSSNNQEQRSFQDLTWIFCEEALARHQKLRDVTDLVRMPKTGVTALWATRCCRARLCVAYRKHG